MLTNSIMRQVDSVCWNSQKITAVNWTDFLTLLIPIFA